MTVKENEQGSEDFAMSNGVDGGAIRKMREYYWFGMGRGIKTSITIYNFVLKERC